MDPSLDLAIVAQDPSTAPHINEKELTKPRVEQAQQQVDVVIRVIKVIPRVVGYQGYQRSYETSASSAISSNNILNDS